jgi:putative flippase GtrA
VKMVRSRFGRFSLVGLMGAVLQLMLMSLLTKCFGALSVAAIAVAIEITILHNFAWHEHFTWSYHGPKSSRQVAMRLWRFHAGNGLISLGWEYDSDVLSGRAPQTSRIAHNAWSNRRLLLSKLPCCGALGISRNA